MSGKYTEVEVSYEVYTQYNRTGWKIENKNKLFYEHEIQFSALIGGVNNAFENFREFITEYDETEKKAVHKVLVKRLYDCLIFLPKNDRRLIEMLFFEEMTGRECAEMYGVNQKNINKRKQQILGTLHKLLVK